jgi:hypothetical protein
MATITWDKLGANAARIGAAKLKKAIDNNYLLI